MSKIFHSFSSSLIFQGRSYGGLSLPKPDIKFIYGTLEPINTYRAILAANSKAFLDFFEKIGDHRVDEIFPFYRYIRSTNLSGELVVIDMSKSSFREEFGLSVFAATEFFSFKLVCELMIKENAENPSLVNMFNVYYVCKKFGFGLIEDIFCDMMLNSNNNILIRDFLQYDIPEAAGIYIEYYRSIHNEGQLEKVYGINNFYVMMSLLLKSPNYDYKECIMCIDHLFLAHPDDIKQQLIHHKECTEAAFVVANAMFKYIKEDDESKDEDDKYIFFVDYQLDWVFSDVKYKYLKSLCRKRKDMIEKVERSVSSHLSSWACFALFDAIMYCDRDVDDIIKDCFKYMRNLGAVSSKREGVYPKINLFRFGFININDHNYFEAIGYAQNTDTLDEFFINRFYYHEKLRHSRSARGSNTTKVHRELCITIEFKNWKFLGSIKPEDKENASRIELGIPGDRNKPFDYFQIKSDKGMCHHIKHTFTLDGKFA